MLLLWIFFQGDKLLLYYYFLYYVYVLFISQVKIVDGASVFVRIGDARRREELENPAKVSFVFIIIRTSSNTSYVF